MDLVVVKCDLFFWPVLLRKLVAFCYSKITNLEGKLATLRLDQEEKELGAMTWVLKMDDATIESGLVHDFDASLSGIGQELGAGAYSMRSGWLS